LIAKSTKLIPSRQDWNAINPVHTYNRNKQVN
jgi:hypothetical protein